MPINLPPIKFDLSELQAVIEKINSTPIDTIKAQKAFAAAKIAFNNLSKVKININLY